MAVPVAVVSLFLVLLIAETRTSWLESRLFSFTAARLTYSIAPGPSPRTVSPSPGPYDLRLGYSTLPTMLQKLQENGYRIQAQARPAKLSLDLKRIGINPVYREKTQAGLIILDRSHRPMYQFQDPRQLYTDFQSVPPVVVQTVLFMENRHMLEQAYPYRNPAIEWGRLAHAMVEYGVHKMFRGARVIGGSTLATQLEKLRHFPEGKTHSPIDKLRQMATASLRAYQDGPRTLAAQQQIILDYINSIPLAATPGHGEVTGLADGLQTWFGSSVDEVNRLLATVDEDSLNPTQMNRRARAYREIVSLFVALRQPSYYLAHNPAALATETDRYLGALYKGGIISRRLQDAALKDVWPRPNAASSEPSGDFAAQKAADAIRFRLLSLFGLHDTYALDRMDLAVQTSFDESLQQSVTAFLQSLSDPASVAKAGLSGYQLLSPGLDPSKITYSFTLYERGDAANLLLAQADNFDQPLNINEGTRLQLGSTAKLRTLITYLQVIEQLHDQYVGMSSAQLEAAVERAGDPLTEWAIAYLETADDRTLQKMLHWAMQREYSGSPGETFFTAGGSHHFENFESSENAGKMTVEQGFEQSVNLVFVRLMRDIENYYIYRVPGASPSILANSNDPARRRYLERSADEEGSTFLERFYRRYKGQTSDQALDLLARSAARRGTIPPFRLAVIYRSVRPSDDVDKFAAFLQKHLPAGLFQSQNIDELYSKYGPDKFNLNDRGYLARVHPLELWLLWYEHQHPEATLPEILAGSVNQRQEVYRWLFRPNHRYGQNLRIRAILEEDAFQEIWKGWHRLGYPFNSLVPSYATSIGVSGDTPQALAELAGIIANGGVRYPLESIQQLDFGSNTPMQAVVTAPAHAGERVLSPAIVDVARHAMLGVVQNGTGRRLQKGFVLPDGKMVPVAGKTGTGDNRFKVFFPGGQLVADRVVNRTAAFVFIIGDRLFGSVTAFVPGKGAADYKFTSALAVQVLKDLGPQIAPLLERQ